MHMAKKWPEIVIKWSFMRDIHFETVFTVSTVHKRFSMIYHLPDPYKNCSSLTADILGYNKDLAKKFECKYMKVGTRHLFSYL